MRSTLLALAALALGACGPATVPPDAGTPPDDAGRADGGAVDAGPTACVTDTPTSADLVATERGLVRGQATDAGRAFRGIPYVAPPTGALRWRPPAEERTCWPAVRDALAFGPRCPQLDQQQGQPFDAGAPYQGDEDCLTLNVFTPASARPDAGLPVLVFIHGGGNTVGSAAETFGEQAPVHLYDGTTLAQRGNVVVVTLQYRLGVLGFLTLPALDREADAGTSGNYALLDQQAALRWVQRNVASFGGDPSRVLLFGESAGAVNTCTHLALPGSRGLFHRAVVQSGSCVAALPTSTRQTEGTTWLGGTGCAGAADVSACLRGLTPEQLIRAYPVPVVVGARRPAVSWGPTVDGVVLPTVPLEAIRLGRHNAVPLVVGSNADETGLTTPLITTDAEYRAAVTGLVGPALTDAVLQRYPVATYGTPRRALVQVTTDAFFGCQARLATRAAAQGQPTVPVHRYLFSRAFNPARGAFHGLELVYVFQKLGDVLPTPPAADVAIEAALLGYWTRLASGGDPNGVGAVSWPRLSASEPLLRVDAQVSSESGWRTAECDFWDSVGGVSVPPPPP